MRMKKALVATDDPHTAAWVKTGLADIGLTLGECRLSQVGAELLREEYHLTVIDGGRSPGVIVQSVEKSVAAGSMVRMLLLVESEALGSLRMPVRVSSDFVVRGAPSSELMARARMLLWPGEEVASSELIRVGDVTINLATYQAYTGNEPIDFAYLEYALLTFLVTHPNRAYSREVLLRRVWGTDYFGGSRTVDVHIRRIRAKLPHEAAGRLETVRNVGYLWRD